MSAASPLRIAVVRKNNLPIAPIHKAIRTAGFAADQKKPDFVLAIGGDGTLLKAERAYSGVPKVMVRESLVCHNCEDTLLAGALDRLKNKRFRIMKLTKLTLSCRVRGKTVTKHCINEFSLRNKLMTRALRFTVKVNGKRVKDHDSEVIIGDGAVIATPFGSTGYFFSIAQKGFTKGIGICFNNTRSKIMPIFCKENSTIEITLVRHDAQVCADNDPAVLTIKEGETIRIKKSNEPSRIVRFG